jgi:AraC-like DNA-binding protein
LSILSRVIYSIVVFVQIHHHGRSVPDYYSRLTIRNTLSWLFYLILIYIILFLINTVVLLFPFIPGVYMSAFTAVVRILPSILFIFFFSLFARNQNIPEDRTLIEENKSEEREKYTNSGLTSGESKKLFEELKEYLLKEKPYLNPDLTLNGDRFPHYTILAIAMECGFKSTSAFYSLFKKSMGKTPKEYMRERGQSENFCHI